MSGGKGRGQQSRDTSEDALVARPGAADPLLAAREGATDAQIAHALRQGLPHLTDPASLQDSRDGKQPQGIGIHAESGKKDYEQKKRTRTTRQATQTQPLLLAADAFAAALGAVPAEDWCRTWAAGRTIMLTRTSKRVKEVVDKMRLPAVVRLIRSFWADARNGTVAEKRKFVMCQLTLMTACCADEEDAHHEASYADATIAARRRRLCCSSGSRSCGGLVQDLGGWQDDRAEQDLEESQRGCGQDASDCRCPLEQELLGRRP